MIDQSAEIWIHPARYSGKPCVGGRRVPVECVANTVWLDGGIPSAMADWNLSRETVLVACWYAGIYGDVDPYEQRTPGNGRKRRDMTWIRRWRAWADQSGGAMWSGQWDEVPDPPTSEKEGAE